MKFEATLNYKMAKLLREQDEALSFKEKAIKAVIVKIRKGGSALKDALATNQITMADVVKAIKHNRCLRIAKRDFGASYLEQIIGTAIREVIPTSKINDVRSLFGLKRLPPSELNPKPQNPQVRQPTNS